MAYRTTEKPAKNMDGKFIIEPDTPNKEQKHFYRQKGGSIYYETAGGDDLTDTVQFCLEASKQEQCKVNLNCSYGVIPVNPEMSEIDALGTLHCYILSRESPSNDTKEKIERIKAQQNAPTSMNFEDFYYMEQNIKSGVAKLRDFCTAHDIDDFALKTYYDLAIDYAKSKGGTYDEQVIRATEHFGLPEVITKDNLPELKKKLVLSKDDPRVAEVRNIKTSSRGYQKE